MLVVGLFAFGAAYVGYAQIYGSIDGLPNLPMKYLEAVDKAPPLEFSNESPTIRRIKEAFGPNCVEIESGYPTRLEDREGGIVFAAGRPDPIDNPSKFIRLAPFSMAQFGKPKDGEVTEITTIHSDEAILELERPIGNEREMLTKKVNIVGIELRATPNATARTDPRNGRVIITNNQQSADPNKAFVFKTPGPLFYRTQEHPDVVNNPAAPHIWTSADVEIVNRENQPRPIRGGSLPSVPLKPHDVLTRNILADMALGHHTPPPTITAEGMKIFLKPRNPAEAPKPGGKAGGFSGIRELVLNEHVEFNLWSDGQSSLFGDAKPKAADPKTAADADPALGLTAVGGGLIDGSTAVQRLKDKTLTRICTLGAFYYDWSKNTARFEVAAQANPLLPNNVEVERLSPLGGRDHLWCQLLEIEFNGPISRTPNAPPKGANQPPSSQFKNLRATGASVYLAAESEQMQAFGTALIHETDPAKRLTRSTLRGAPLVAVRQGNRLVTGAAATPTAAGVEGQLVMESIEPPPGTKLEKARRVEVLGPGKVDLFDEVTKTNTMTASWKQSLTQTKDKVGAKDCDLFVFVGDGRFTDPKTGFDLKADTLKLWLEGGGQSNSAKGGPPSSMEAAKPARVQGLGHVEGRSEDSIIRDTDKFNAFFRDVPKPIQQPQPATTTVAAKPALLPPTVTAKGPPPLPFVEPTATVVVEKPKPKPLELSARQIDVTIARSPLDVKPKPGEKAGVRYEIDTARCDGRVIAHQDAAEPGKPVALHIVGETLNIDHLPAGHAMKVLGTNEKLAFVQFEDTIITGPDVDINQPNNMVIVKGRGQLRMPSSTDLAGTPLDEKSEMQIDWQQGMTFKGELRSAEFIGQVQAVQLPPERKAAVGGKVPVSTTWQRSYVICHRLSVLFDRPIYFNQMRQTQNAPTARNAEKKDESKIERVLCEPQPEEDGDRGQARPANFVYFADETFDRRTGKHVKAQRITAKFLDVQVQDTRTIVHATGPGETRNLQLGSKDMGQPAAATPAPVAATPKKSEEEMKLTVVRFAERLAIEDKKQIFQKAVFTSNIRVFHIPTDKLDLDVPEHLAPERSLTLKCTDTLTATTYQSKAGTEDRRTLEAVGDARVRTDDYDGVGHVIKYDGNLVILEAYGDGQATLYRRKNAGVGKERDYKSGNPLTYNTKTGQVSGAESSGGTFSK